MRPTADLLQILLVEDSLPDIELTLEALADAKFANHVSVVRDGQEALDYLNAQGAYTDRLCPDLVILDLNLPKRSGQEVLAEIKGNDELRRIPVAVLTTSAAEADIVRSYDLGANCYLTKPVDVEQFMNVVQSIEEFWLGLVRLPPALG